jgi:small conductance mechanosensitive channel
MTERRFAFLRLVALMVAIGGALALTSTRAGAQSFPGLSLATPGPSNAAAIDALYASAPVTIDGVTLFQIAEPLAGSGHQPVAVRANAVSDALDEILATTEHDGEQETVYDPQTLHVEVVHDNGQVVLQAVDAHHTAGVVIVTVTSADAEYAQSSIDAVAQQWQAIMQKAIVRALTIRQPENQRKNVTMVAAAGGILALLTFIVWLLCVWFNRRIAAIGATLDARDEQIAQTTGDAAPGYAASHEEQHRRMLGLLVRKVDPQKQQTLLRALRLMAISIAVLAWFAGVTWALSRFPESTGAAHWLLRNGFGVAVIWIGALLVDRILTITVDRLPTLWELRAFGTTEDKQRQLLRAPTIARALGGLKAFIIYFIALLATMTQIGIPVGSVVTLGGLAAIGVSLAAQNLIRDVVSGFLVLIEDQFVVGDFVTINGSRGSVERLTLRMVQIRDVTGSLVTISNSAATLVINHSRNWSRVDYDISVDIAADVPYAISLLRQQIADLETDPKWKGAIVEPAEWIGIDQVSRDGAVVRARIKTAPLQQFALRRELNERVVKAFAAAKIGYGAPVPPET